MIREFCNTLLRCVVRVHLRSFRATCRSSIRVEYILSTKLCLITMFNNGFGSSAKYKQKPPLGISYYASRMLDGSWRSR